MNLGKQAITTHFKPSTPTTFQAKHTLNLSPFLHSFTSCSTNAHGRCPLPSYQKNLSLYVWETHCLPNFKIPTSLVTEYCYVIRGQENGTEWCTCNKRNQISKSTFSCFSFSSSFLSYVFWNFSCVSFFVF